MNNENKDNRQEPTAIPLPVEHKTQIELKDIKWLLYYGYNTSKSIVIDKEERRKIDFAVELMFDMLAKHTYVNRATVEEIFWKRICLMLQAPPLTDSVQGTEEKRFGEWISVGDRLPEVYDVKGDTEDDIYQDSDFVLASNEDGVYVACCKYQPENKTWYMYGDYASSTVEVTHWMPLPPKPTQFNN